MAAAMVDSSPSPNRIPRESFYNAIASLLKWNQSQPKHEKSQLFEADDIIYLILTLTRIPSSGRTNPHRIPIPHPLHPFDSQSTSICLIVDDCPASPLPPAAALDQIRTRNLPIASVIGLMELRSDYRPFESRRKLCDSYDLFFADRKIIPLLPRLLGKHFFKRKKIPLAVDSSRAGWSEQIKAWCESSLLYLRTGTCSGLKIGRVNQTADEIVENAVAVIEGAMEHVPKKWGNLRSLHVKTVESVALPVYQAVPEIGLKIEGPWDEERVAKRKKRVRGEEGEETNKKLKKEKKGRIHDLVDDGDVVESEEMVVDNVVGELSEKSKKKKKNKKVEMDAVVVSDSVEKSKTKKKKRGDDVEDGNLVVDNVVESEEMVVDNVVGELSEKSKKNKHKKKVEMDAVVVSDSVENGKTKKKKKRGDDVEDGNLVVCEEKRVKKVVKGSAKQNVVSDTSAKKTKKDKKLGDVVMASDGTKKVKAKSQKREA